MELGHKYFVNCACIVTHLPICPPPPSPHVFLTGVHLSLSMHSRSTAQQEHSSSTAGAQREHSGCTSVCVVMVKWRCVVKPQQ